jgi:prepilin-type N-terminal cleavage/methylation domain-containing protein
MSRGAHNSGFTLIELAVVVVVIGVLALLTVPAISSWISNLRVVGATREMANVLSLARAEAIRSRVNHLVVFGQDGVGNPLQTPDGQDAAVLLARDDDGDGLPDPGEIVTSIPVDPSGQLSWGVSLATTRAPGDPQGVDGAPPVSPWTFQQPTGALAQWVLFMPDGMPRGYRVAPYGAGGVGDGAGAVYLTNGARDYAVVLAPLGGVNVLAWNPAAGQWRE